MTHTSLRASLNTSWTSFKCTHLSLSVYLNWSQCVVLPCSHAVTACWKRGPHEELQLQVGLLPGFLGRSPQRLLLSDADDVWERPPRALRGSAKSHSGGGEADHLEKEGSCPLKPAAPPSPCRYFTPQMNVRAREGFSFGFHVSD